MKKRIWIGLGILLALVTFAVLMVPEYRLTFLGYLGRENRFEGRPTSYWRYKVEIYCAPPPPNRAAMNYLEKLLDYFSMRGAREKPSVLAGKPEALPVLIDLIRAKTSPPVTEEAYRAIGTMGRPIAKDALPFLEEEMNGQDVHLRIVAVRTLGRFSPDGIPLLIKALKNDSPDVRSSAAYTLQEIGYGPKGLVPRDAVLALVDALNDEVENVRTAAARALVTVDPDEAEKVHAERFIPRLPGYLGRK